MVNFYIAVVLWVSNIELRRLLDILRVKVCTVNSLWFVFLYLYCFYKRMFDVFITYS